MLQAREWLRGGWPYVAVWDMHPPGAPALFAAAFAVLGESLFTVRLLGVLAVAATGGALVLLARAAGAPRAVGLAAGLIYAGHSLLLNGVPTNTEILFAPFVALTMAAATAAARRSLRGGAPPDWRDTLLMGAPMGLALLLKTNVVMEGSAAFLLFAGAAWRGARMPVGRLAALAVIYALACAAPTLLAGFAYFLRGDLTAFISGNVLGPLHYLGEAAPLAEALREVAIALLDLAWLLALGAFALATAARRRGQAMGGRPDAWLLPTVLLLWLAAAIASVAVTGKFYDHYFLTCLPPLAVFGALGARELARLARPGPAATAFAVVVGAATLLPWTASVSDRVRLGFGLRNPVARVAAAVAAEIEPGDPIYVVNYDPIVYVLAHGGVPTPYAFPQHLADRSDKKMGLLNPAGIDRGAEVARVLRTRPRVIVLHRGTWSGVHPAAAALITDALETGYTRVDAVEAAGGPVEIWRRL